MKFNIRIGMPEIMFIASVYMYQVAFTASMILMTIGLSSCFCRYMLEWSEANESKKKLEKLTQQYLDTSAAYSVLKTTPVQGDLH